VAKIRNGEIPATMMMASNSSGQNNGGRHGSGVVAANEDGGTCGGDFEEPNANGVMRRSISNTKCGSRVVEGTISKQVVKLISGGGHTATVHMATKSR
jgi:hypothetical protein